MSDTNEMVCVCVDAAGGDRDISCVLEGVAQALCADEHLKVLLTGPAESIVDFAAQQGPRCEAHPTTQIIGMGEHPADAVTHKKDSSIVVGCKLVKEGRAQGFFSAGSTGAVMTAATLIIGRITSIQRPALTAVLPGPKPTVFLDLGANADCKTDYLVQFAHMGAAYASVCLGIEAPRIALLNVGAEDAKGSMFIRECHAALREHVSGFAGNAEGTDLLAGSFDVIVADGFSGNIALKSMEGTAKYAMKSLMAAARSSAEAAQALKTLSPSLAQLQESLSGDEYGGAVLLGVKAPVAIGHGATSARAVMNGTLLVARSHRGALVDRIARACAV